MGNKSRRTRRLAGVKTRIDSKNAAGKNLGLPRNALRHKLAPLVDSGAGDSESLRGGAYAAPEVADDVCGSHGRQMYRTLTPHVKHSNARRPDNAAMQTMGQRIRTLREAQRMTQTDLAKAVGVSRGAVAQWELGIVANIRLQAFLRLCQVLRTDPQYLLFGSDRLRQSRSRAGGTGSP
jgi:DNA-binding XRE family transcriptional regulator